MKTALLSTAALALAITSAGAQPQTMLSNDKRFVAALPHGGGQSVPAERIPGTYVMSTIDPSAVGAYYCCYGDTVSGPSSLLGVAYGVAEQFELKEATTVRILLAAVGYVSGDQSVTLSLYADNGSNEPGTLLAQGTGSVGTALGFCCGLVKVKIKKTRLSADTPYWVAITTTGSNYEAAELQVFNEVDHPVYVSFTSNGGSTWNAGVLEAELYPAIGVK